MKKVQPKIMFINFPPVITRLSQCYIFFKTINYFSIINSPRGILVLPNMQNKTITGISSNLQKLFDVNPTIDADYVIKKFKTPHSYFIHCDLMNKTENLLNGKPSNLLAKFQSAGSLMKKLIIFLHRMGSFVTPLQEIIIYIVAPFLSKTKMEICLTSKVFL